ncbi:unnamed protein product [Rhizophagus irregularis]|nr:unnamed protein product [Rhizophagus irregularis]
MPFLLRLLKIFQLRNPSKCLNVSSIFGRIFLGLLWISSWFHQSYFDPIYFNLWFIPISTIFDFGGGYQESVNHMNHNNSVTRL